MRSLSGFALLSIGAVLFCGSLQGAIRPVFDKSIAAGDRRIQWFPAAAARMLAVPGAPERSVSSRGVTLHGATLLTLHLAPPEDLPALERARRLPVAAFLRVDVEAGGPDAFEVFRFDPRAPRRVLVSETAVLTRENRHYFAPPPFPGIVSWAVRARDGRPVTVSCSLSRVRRPRGQWERLEERAREALDSQIAWPDADLSTFLDDGTHDSSELAWRQCAVLPWPESPGMPLPERDLRRAAFFLGTLEARAGERDAMDPESIEPALDFANPAGAATRSSPQLPAPAPGASRLRLADVDYLQLPGPATATFVTEGPRMLRVATRALHGEDSGEEQVGYRIRFDLDGRWREARDQTTVPDDEKGLIRTPSGQPVGRERVVHFLIPPGRHGVALHFDTPILLRLDLERARQGVGESAREDPGAALARCLRATSNLAGLPVSRMRQALAIRAAAFDLLGRSKEAAETARLALEVHKDRNAPFTAWLETILSSDEQGRQDFARAQERLTAANALLKANGGFQGLVGAAIDREVRRRLARILALRGYPEAGATLLRELLRSWPNDATVRLEMARLLSVRLPYGLSRSTAWPEADLAWLATRLDPEKRTEAARLWSESSRWRLLQPSAGSEGPGSEALLAREPLVAGPAVLPNGDLPFRGFDSAGTLFELAPNPGWLGEAEASVRAPIGPLGFTPFPLQLILELPAGHDHSPSAQVDGQRVHFRREAGRWKGLLEVRPGMRHIRWEAPADSRVLCNFPSASIEAAWRTGRAPLVRWSLEACVRLPSDPAKSLQFSPTPGPIRGALELLASTAGQPLRTSVELCLDIQGEAPRRLILLPGGSEVMPYQAALPLPAGAGRVSLRRLVAGGPALNAQLSERLARTVWAPPPLPPVLAFAEPVVPPSELGALPQPLQKAAMTALSLGPYVPRGDTPADETTRWIASLRRLTAAMAPAARPAAMLSMARGRLLERLGYDRLALADFLMAGLDSRATRSVRWLALEGVMRARAAAGEWREALQRATALLLDGDDHWPLRLFVVRALLERGDARQAIAALQPLVTRFPKRTDAAVLLCETLALLGREREALERTPAGSGDARLDYARAVLQARLGRFAEAATALRPLTDSKEVLTKTAAARRLMELDRIAKPTVRGAEIALARATWFERSTSRRWEPSEQPVNAFEFRIQHFQDGAPTLASSYRVSPGSPLDFEVQGPGLLRLAFRPDCPPGGKGSAAWKISIDGHDMPVDGVEDVAASADIAMPEMLGAVPGEAAIRTLAIPPGRHVVRVAGAPSAFSVRPTMLLAAYDDLLAPCGSPSIPTVRPADGETVELLAWSSARLGQWSEALRAVSLFPSPASTRAELLAAEVLMATGDAAAARARLGRLRRSPDADSARAVAALHRALSERDPPGFAGPNWDDTMRALAHYERLLGREPADDEMQAARQAVTERLSWDDAGGLESQAGSLTLALTGPSEPQTIPAQVRAALEYNPWGSGNALVLGRDRLELELDTRGELGVRLSLHSRRPPRGAEPPPPAGATTTLLCRIDGSAPQEWTVPLSRLYQRALPELSAGGHVLSLALSDRDGRTSVAVKVEVDREVRLDRGQLVLGARTPGRWRTLPLATVRRWRVATHEAPASIAVRGPVVARVFARALSPGARPCVLDVNAESGGWLGAGTLGLPSDVDSNAALVERTGVTVCAERMLVVPLDAALDYTLTARPPPGVSTLVRIEVPVPGSPPLPNPVNAQTPVTVALGGSGPTGPSRILPAEMSDLLGRTRHAAGTIRYRVRYVEGLRPEIDDFRLERHVDAGVTFFRRRADRPVTELWEAESRLRVEGPPAQVIGYRYFHEAPRDGGPRASVSSQLIGQEVRGRAETTLRAEATYGRSIELRPRLRHAPEAGLQLFASTLSSTRGANPPHVDSELFTRFDRTHPKALAVQDTLTWSPHTDRQLYARGRAVTNSSLMPHDIDRVSLRLGTRQLAGPFELDAHYTRTERLADNLRPSPIKDNDAALEVSFWRWLIEGRFLTASANLLYRGRFDEWLPGIAVNLSADRGRLFDDLPPGFTSFEAAKEAASPAGL